MVSQRFDRAGQPTTRRFVVSGQEPGLASSPRAARLSDGKAIVVWQVSEPGADEKIFGRLLNRRGAPVQSAFRVDSSSGSTGSRPAVAAGDDGGFLVAWQGCCDGDGSAIFARRFESRAQPAGEPFLINAVETGDQLWPAVARGGSGEFLMAWMGPGSAYGDLETRIYGQLLGADAEFLGPELTLSGGAGCAHGAPAVIGTGAGYFVAWTVWGRHFLQGIQGAEVGQAGEPSAEFIALNTGRLGFQWRLSLSGDGTRRHLAAWEGFDGDGNPSINIRSLAEAQPDI